MRWVRKDMVTGDPLEADIPITVENGSNYVSILIPLEAYKRLVEWCSVGRTIDIAIEAAENANHSIAIEELELIQSSLDAVHTACRNHWWKHKCQST